MRLTFRAACAAALLAPAALAAQEPCPGRMPRTATLGVGFFHCVGGNCSLNVKTVRGVSHDFSTEPRVWNVDPAGPAAGRLREGDVITSVDGALVTTPEGGLRLANLRPGRPVELGVRRGAGEATVRVVPAPGCNVPGLVVNASTEKPEWPGRWMAPGGGEHPDARGEAPPVRFGMQLECGECGWHRGPNGWHFHSTRALRVKEVDAGGPAERAGIRAGDVLLRVAGRPFTAVGGSVGVSTLKPGDGVRVEVLRDGQMVSFILVPVVTSGGGPDGQTRLPLVRGGSGNGRPDESTSVGGGGGGAPDPAGGNDMFLPRPLVSFDDD